MFSLWQIYYSKYMYTFYMQIEACNLQLFVGFKGASPPPPLNPQSGFRNTNWWHGAHISHRLKCLPRRNFGQKWNISKTHLPEERELPHWRIIPYSLDIDSFGRVWIGECLGNNVHVIRYLEKVVFNDKWSEVCLPLSDRPTNIVATQKILKTVLKEFFLLMIDLAGYL